MVELEVEITGAERVHELRALWLALHDHHKRVASLQPLVGDDELSWQRRRALYHHALSTDGGFLVIANNRRQPVGYAIYEGPDDTWPVAASYAGNTAFMRLYERRGLLPGEVVLYRFGLHGRSSTNIADRSSEEPE